MEEPDVFFLKAARMHISENVIAEASTVCLAAPKMLLQHEPFVFGDDFTGL